MENREILFRGIRKDSREWVEGVPIESNMNGEGYETFMYTDHTIHNAISLRVGGGHFGRCVEVIPETVGQFTGLLDINGKRIFEGDIVQSATIRNRQWIIEYRNDSEFVGFVPCEIGKVKNSLSTFVAWNTLEVIGNIHLKGE